MGKYSIPITERERKYSEKNENNNELLVYFVDPKRLEEVYPTVKKESKYKKNWNNQKTKGGNEKVKINMKIVRDDLEKGLSKDEIVEKYNADARAVGMLISRVKNQDKKSISDKEEKNSLGKGNEDNEAIIEKKQSNEKKSL